MSSIRRYFDAHAHTLDRRAARGVPLRPGPQRARELAVAAVAELDGPSVLDVGCGTGATAEAVLAAGASRYVGIDLSPGVLAIARARLEESSRLVLIEGDFVDHDLRDTFELVLALGVLEYVADAAQALRWLHGRCRSTLVASFTRWDWVKGPVRHAHYRLYGCALRDYSPDEARELLAAAGFSRIDVQPVSRRGFLVVAGVS